MADFSIDDLWWLKTAPPRDRSPAMALGARIAEARADNIRQEEALKTRTAMGMMNLMLEKERNGIALQTFRTKQEGDLLRSRAMSDIGDYLGEATKNDKLTDPETQAGFWRLTSKYAPFIPETAVNSMWDNTFKSAMDRKAKADGHDESSPASVEEFNFREVLREKYNKETNPTIKSERLDDLRRFEVKAGFTKGDPLSIEEVIGTDGKSHQILRSPNGQTRLLPSIDESKISQIDLVTYRSELKSLQDAWTNMDDIVLTDGKPDPAKYRKLRDDLYSRFSKPKAAGAAPSPASPASDPLGLFK